MADTDKEESAETPKKGGGGIVGQVIVAVMAGAAAFGTVWFLPAKSAPVTTCESAELSANAGETLLPELSLGETAFVEMDPLIVTLGEEGSARQLRIGLTLESALTDSEAVNYATPKLRDAFTGYLRAVSIADLEAQDSIVRLRAQLQRRAQVVLGDQSVRNVLITDFVIR